MTTPASGTISLNNILTELGASGTISLNNSSVRSLAQVPSGSISLSNLYFKSIFSMVAGVINSGANAYGYDFSSVGSIDHQFFAGNLISSIVTFGNSSSFSIAINANLSVNFFNYISIPQLSATFQTSSAGFSGGSTSTWTWFGYAGPYFANGNTYTIYTG
ncbi:MAG: hypothetical protein ACREQ5_35775 [Candidatus Dormibacteria bacterium]